MIGKEIDAYRILEKIGQGGMGIVYKAVHTKLEQEVAIKVLSPEFSHDPAMRERFVKEAKIQARFSHASVVNILNYIEQAGNIYLVMEFVPGETLEHLLRRGGGVPPERAVSICLGVLDALDFMHSKGVIHRDIKPGNIMFTERGDVKVTDFGIAKMVGEKGQTRTGMRIGTLWYMSPEQIKGGNASVVSDIYALGATLYQMVAGKVPFGGNSEYAVMKGHLEEKPVPPWEINSAVSKDLGRIILKALHKDPGSRYQTAGEFADDLRRLASQAARVAAPQAKQGWVLPVKVPSVHIPVKEPLARLSGWLSSLGIPKVGNRTLISIILAAVILVILILVLLFMGRNDRPSFPLSKGGPATAGLPSQAPAHEEPKPSKPDPPSATAPAQPPPAEVKPAEAPAAAAETPSEKKTTSKQTARKKSEKETKTAKQAREAREEKAKEAKEKREAKAKEAREKKEARVKAAKEAKEAKEEKAKEAREARTKEAKEAKEKAASKAKETEKASEDEGKWKIRR